MAIGAKKGAFDFPEVGVWCCKFTGVFITPVFITPDTYFIHFQNKRKLNIYFLKDLKTVA